MANEEQLTIIKQGVNVWNDWRKSNPDVEIDLQDAPLRDAQLQRINLKRAHLERANLMGANLQRAELHAAHLQRSVLRGTHLQGAFLIGAHLQRADLQDANCHGADFQRADIQRADLLQAHLQRADLKGANLYWANLCQADLRKADLRESNLREANLTEAHVSGIKYLPRKTMRGKYLGIRGIDSCYGNPIFKRDAQDQDYIDALEAEGRHILLLWLWRKIDYGRSMMRVALMAFVLMGGFGYIFSIWHGLINMPQNKTFFTPYYFSIVTYTTLGFGDVNAVGNVWGEIIVCIEVLLGYITLGLLLAILANTVARRS